MILTGVVGKIPWGWIALLAVLGIDAWRNAALLMQSPIAVGVDGYYYVLQVNTLWSRHHLFFPSSYPLVLYWLAGVRHLTGDAVVATRIGSVVLHLALCGGIFAVIRAVTHSLWLGVLGCALLTASSLRLYFVAEFVNNLGATALLAWSCWAAIRSLQTHRRAYVFAAVILLAAAAYSHRAALPIALAFAGSVFLSRRITSSPSAMRRGRLITLVVVASWLVPAALGASASIDLPAWLRNDLSGVPRWPWERHSLAEAIILLIISPAVLVLLSRRPADSRGKICPHVFGAAALLALLFTLNPFIKSAEVWGGVAERLRGLAYIQVAILVPGVAWMTLPGYQKVAPYLIALVLPLMILGNTVPPPPGLRPAYIQHRAQMIGRLRGYLPEISTASIIVAPHGDQFVVTAMTGIQSQRRMPSQTEGRTVYWLLRRMRCDAPAPTALVLASDGGNLCTMLIEDNELRQESKLLSVPDKQRLLAANPHIRGSVAKIGLGQGRP